MRIGLALGGGGVRGLAHVAALEVLDAAGIQPVAVAGTSMGSIIGVMYAAGLSGSEIREQVARHVIQQGDSLKSIFDKKDELLQWINAVRPTRSSGGLFKADGFLHYLLDRLGVQDFEDLKLPFHVMAADYYRGEPVDFTQGPLFPAIKASMAIPGVFVPVEHQGRFLVDGGVVNNLPYDVLQPEVDATIAIDVAPTRSGGMEKGPGTLEATIGMFDILTDRVTAIMRETQPPTLYVRPRLQGIRVLDFDKVNEVFEQAKPVMDRLAEVLREGAWAKVGAICPESP